MNPPAVLVGVDIVESGRLARAAHRGGELLARHVATAAERRTEAGRVAFSVKESLIKAVGGRPPGFTWHDFEAVAAPAAAWTMPLLDEAADELTASTGLPYPYVRSCLLWGPARRVRRLATPRRATAA
ncbi:4'-phosphopantetheinyl transferase superfamily protein, partial [Nonomuraea dietziae]|uniref:4'-phosphopantetheinyl transferase superfamily protein n=1 Tax=Nonomuraea dietziae TaxID=65515 RepID=UPI003322FEEC